MSDVIVLETEDEASPNRLADRFLTTRFVEDQTTLLRRWRGEWWLSNLGWKQVDSEFLRAQIRAFLDNVYQPGSRRQLVPMRVTSRLIAEVEGACVRCSPMQPETLTDGEMPRWLSNRDRPRADRVIAFRNGMLNVDAWIRGKVEFEPLTPDWFGTAVCPFDFDECSDDCSQWLQFLDKCAGGDAGWVELLQAWFGYCLTPDTSYQKMALLVGPPRSGKGTIARVLRHLVGADNVAGPTLAGLGTNFGLWPLLGRSLAIIADARLSGHSDQAIITERLLSITGEDAQTIDRKNLPPITCRLGTRFMILTNELPKLSDASGALANRFLILQLRESFLGREDVALTDKLLSESPAILLWALQGLRALHRIGHFVVPESTTVTIEELQDLSSPVRQFVRECCVVEPGPQTIVGEAYGAWCWWCSEKGRQPGESNIFARDLKAAFPQLVTRQSRLAIEGQVVRVFDGIRLTELVTESAAQHRAARSGRGR